MPVVEMRRNSACEIYATADDRKYFEPTKNLRLPWRKEKVMKKSNLSSLALDNTQALNAAKLML